MEEKAGAPATSDVGRLAAAARGGSLDAYGQLYNANVVGVHDFLLRTLLDPELAEELTQLALKRGFTDLDTLENPDRYRPWLFGIALGLATDHLRSQAPVPQPLLGAAARNPTAFPHLTPAEQAEMAGLVWAAAVTLDREQYALLDLSVRQLLDVDVVARLHQAGRTSRSQAGTALRAAQRVFTRALKDVLTRQGELSCAILAGLHQELSDPPTAKEIKRLDDHFSRCPECKPLGERVMVANALASLAPLPLPEALARDGWERLAWDVVRTAPSPVAGAPAAAGGVDVPTAFVAVAGAELAAGEPTEYADYADYADHADEEVGELDGHPGAEVGAGMNGAPSGAVALGDSLAGTEAEPARVTPFEAGVAGASLAAGAGAAAGAGSVIGGSSGPSSASAGGYGGVNVPLHYSSKVAAPVVPADNQSMMRHESVRRLHEQVGRDKRRSVLGWALAAAVVAAVVVVLLLREHHTTASSSTTTTLPRRPVTTARHTTTTARRPARPTTRPRPKPRTTTTTTTTTTTVPVTTTTAPPPVPVVSSLSPTSGFPGAPITLTGGNFVGSDLVAFTGPSLPGGTETLTPTSVSANSISSEVPSFAVFAGQQIRVAVQNADGTTSGRSELFNVLAYYSGVWTETGNRVQLLPAAAPYSTKQQGQLNLFATDVESEQCLVNESVPVYEPVDGGNAIAVSKSKSCPGEWRLQSS